MGKKLVFIQSDQVITTSLKVAEVFGKEHKNVIRDIRTLIEQIEDGSKLSTPLFSESTYINQQNKTQPMYLMNRDGFTLLAMGFTGKKALQFKLAFISAFNRMEQKLKELLESGKDAKWLETRKHGKESRRQETSAIKAFIEHARLQGCTWDEKFFYSTISIWCNIGAGLPKKNGRDDASIHQLNIVDLLEGTIVKRILIDGMADNLPYTQIWARVQKQIDAFLEVTFQTPKLIEGNGF